MSKTLWHTIKIQVPQEMVEITKAGRVSVKKTLTKTMNISKSNKQPSIELLPADVTKPQILNDGKEWDVNTLKQRIKKSNELRKKNIKQKEVSTIDKIVKFIQNKKANQVKKELHNKQADDFFEANKNNIENQFAKSLKTFVQENQKMPTNIYNIKCGIEQI